MTTIKIILAVLKVVGIILGHLEKQGVLTQAKKQVLADALVELNQRVGIANEVRKEVDGLSDAAVRERLRGDFRD